MDMPTNEAAAARSAAIMRAMGREIAAERTRRGITQERLAELTGYEVSKRQVGKIERGEAGQTVETLLLAEVLGVDYGDLYRAARSRTA